jgi:hypothetical protein
MANRTTVTLLMTVSRQGKASGLPLSEVIGHGLGRPGDTARHAATEARLTAEQRLAQLEARGAIVSLDDHQADDLDVLEAPDHADLVRPGQAA